MKISHLFYLFSAIFSQMVYSTTQYIGSAKIEFYSNINNPDNNKLKNYIDSFLGMEVSSKILSDAENFLNSQYFLTSASCIFQIEKDINLLICKVEPKKTIKQITVSNLPNPLLRKEFEKKLPLSIGQFIDINSEALEEIKKNITNKAINFLRAKGFYNAKIEIKFNLIKNSNFIEVVINISDGHFIYVNNVEIIGDFPINKKVVKRSYSTMCLSFQNIFQAINMGTFACYTRELEDETTSDLELKLSVLGFFENRIRVIRTLVDPHQKGVPSRCQGVAGNPSCIDLKIEIDKGPKATIIFKFLDNHSVKRNPLINFIGKLFFVDNFSRQFSSLNNDEKYADNMITSNDLTNEITMINARSMDDNELESSKESLLKFLQEKGYANAKITYRLINNKDDNIKIIFFISTEKRYYIKEIHIEPEEYLEYIDKKAALDIMPVKSWLSIGAVTNEALEKTKEYITQALNKKGFYDAKVESIIESDDIGEVNVIYYISSEKRNILQKIKISGGVEKLNKKIFSLLSNCDNYNSKSKNNCQNSSLIKKRIDSDKNIIVDFYKENGYLYVDITSDLIQNKDGYELVFYVFDQRYGSENPSRLTKQNIKEIIISGNESTLSSVIERLFSSPKKKNLITPNSLRNGINYLKESGNFSLIENKILASSYNSDEVYFLVNLQEKLSLSLSVALAFSTDHLFSIETEIGQSNLFSSMLILKSILNFGLFIGRESYYNNKITWPRVFGSNFNVTFDIPNIKYTDELNLENPQRILESNIGVIVDMISYKGFRPYIGYELDLIQSQKFNKASSPKFKFSEAIKTLDGLTEVLSSKKNLKGVFKVGVDYVFLDNPLDPKKGLNLGLGVELGGGVFYGDTPYGVVSSRNNFYLPLGPFTWAIKLDFFRAFVRPSEENFRTISTGGSMRKLGGDTTIRGYNIKEIGIESISNPIESGAGYFANNAKMELRFPLDFGKKPSAFFGALLMDEGMLIPCESLLKCLNNQTLSSIISKKGLGLSLGAALRYNLPFGLISLEYAFSLLHKQSRFHFLTGYVF